MVSNDELKAHARDIMMQLSALSEESRKARDLKLTRLSNDLFYAANRAWHELDAVVSRKDS